MLLGLILAVVLCLRTKCIVLGHEGIGDTSLCMWYID